MLRKQSLPYLAAGFVFICFLFSCSNAANGSDGSNGDFDYTGDSFRFRGIGTQTISLTSESGSTGNERVAQVSQSLKELVQSDGLTQGLNIDLRYKNKSYSYEDFTGFTDNPPDSTWGINTENPRTGPLHKFSDHDSVWVMKDGNDTFVCLRKGDWDGSEFTIENVIPGFDQMTVQYQIGVLDTLINELNNPRFVPWNNSKQLLETSSGLGLNAHVNGTANEYVVKIWGKRWTDPPLPENCYGMIVEIVIDEAGSAEDINIQFTNDNDGNPPNPPINDDEDINFLSTEKTDSGFNKLWWTCCPAMLESAVPRSLREDLEKGGYFNQVLEGLRESVESPCPQCKSEF